MIPAVVVSIGTKYTKMTGGTTSKNPRRRGSSDSQKTRATMPARKAKTAMGSLRSAVAWGSMGRLAAVGGRWPGGDARRADPPPDYEGTIPASSSHLAMR